MRWTIVVLEVASTVDIRVVCKIRDYIISDVDLDMVVDSKVKGSQRV